MDTVTYCCTTDYSHIEQLKTKLTRIMPQFPSLGGLAGESGPGSGQLSAGAEGFGDWTRTGGSSSGLPPVAIGWRPWFLPSWVSPQAAAEGPPPPPQRVIPERREKGGRVGLWPRPPVSLHTQPRPLLPASWLAWGVQLRSAEGL